MNFNPHWERWCHISICKSFDARRQSVKMFVEGFERATEDEPEYIELRIDGPNAQERAKGQWKLSFEVNVLVSCQQNNTNAYRHKELTGLVASMFVDNIQVRKYGNGADDDQTYIGTMSLAYPKIGGERVQVSHFGMVRPDTRLMQATVEGHYNIFFD